MKADSENLQTSSPHKVETIPQEIDDASDLLLNTNDDFIPQSNQGKTALVEMTAALEMLIGNLSDGNVEAPQENPATIQNNASNPDSSKTGYRAHPPF